MNASIVRAPARLLPLALAAATGLVGASLALPARADEIRYQDPATCETITEQVAEVTDETWTQVSYRPKAGQAIKRIDTRLVVEVKRGGDDSQSNAFRSALTEYQNGNWAGARQAFGNVAGGGLTQDAETGKIVNKPFPPYEPGKTKWYASYAQYYYAAAVYREGLAKNDPALLESGLNALDADSGTEKGFLVRFKEGKSRFYGDAMILKAQLLTALKKYDEAAATYDAVYQKSLTVPIGVRLSYEAKLGPGRIAEAKGDSNAAETAYEAGAAALQSLLDQPLDACSKRDLGRYFNEARMQKARVMLAAAEKADSPPEYARLRAYLLQGTPEALRQKVAGKPADVVDAVLAGALAPSVQAIAQNGIGLSYLSEKKYADAVFAFTNVRIKYFAVGDEVPRALYYLAKAADAAAGAATRPDAKTLFTDQAAAARQDLQKTWKDSPWATRK